MINYHSIPFCGDTFLRTQDGVDPFGLVRSYYTDSQVCINLESSLKGARENNVSLSVSENALAMIPVASWR